MRAEGWRPTTLGQHATLNGGFGFSERFQGASSGEVPFYKVSDMSLPGNESWLTQANNYVSKTLALRQGWKCAPAEGVAFAKVGAALLLNRRRVLTTDSLVDNNMMVAVADGDLDSRWLYWWLQRVDFGIFVQPGALPSVNQGQLAGLSLDLPPLPEQRRIAEILDTLDEAIRKTEQVIAKLQQMKQGLLHDLLTRGIDEHGELRDPERHPELFKDSPLGRIPREWEVAEFERFSWTGRPFLKTGPFGSSLKGEHWVDSGVPVITIGALGEGTFTESDLLFISEQKAAELAAYAVEPGDIVFSRVADVGRSVVVREAEAGWIMSSNLMWISLDPEKVVPAFVWLNLTANPCVRGQVRRSVNYGGREVANGTVLRSLRLAWPGFHEQERLVAGAGAAQTRIQGEQAQLDKLRTLKQGLMDDLLTGRVRVTTPSEAAQ